MFPQFTSSMKWFYWNRFSEMFFSAIPPQCRAATMWCLICFDYSISHYLKKILTNISVQKQRPQLICVIHRTDISSQPWANKSKL